MGKITVDRATLESLQSAYEQEHAVATQAGTYLHANCSLDGAFGTILQLVHPLYNQGRDKGYQALESAGAALAQIGTQVGNALADATTREDSVVQSITVLQQQVADLQQQVDALKDGQGAPAPGGYSGGGGGGGYGGGGYGGGAGGAGGGSTAGLAQAQAAGQAAGQALADATASPQVPPANGAASTDPADDDTITVDLDLDGTTTTITLDGESEEQVKVVTGGSTIVVESDGDGSIHVRATTGDGAADDAPAAPAVPGGTAGADPEQQAAEAAYYEEIWQELADDDPLGRSADELRELWETREGIVIDAPEAGGIGYAPAEPVTLPGLGLLPDDQTPATATTVGHADHPALRVGANA
jgi:hypothetical protein